jgi:HSP20 family protein
LAIRRWDPFGELLNLQERMNRLFEESLLRRPGSAALGSSSWMPLADAFETSEGFVVEVELPGIEPDDVDVHVNGEELVIRGGRHLELPSRPEAFHRIERSYGPFVRTFQLGVDVEAARITARLQDGVLRVELPKRRVREPNPAVGRAGRPRRA